MATNLSIECADRSVRWYLTPGQSSRYEIIVINKSGDEHVDCTMSLDEPAEGGTFEPASFSLRPRERKTVALTFAETAQVPRDQLTLISVRDAAGDVIASLERGLISAGGIDCTIQLAWKEPILDGDAIRGFVISCAVKSLSATGGQFALQPTPHQSLEFVDVAPLRLEPGQTQTVTIPILWKRAVKDAQGNNHPHVVEMGVAVSQGKRTGRLSWDTIESKLSPYERAEAAEAAAAHEAQSVQPAQVVQPAPPPQPMPPPLAPASAPPNQTQTALAIEAPTPPFVNPYPGSAPEATSPVAASANPPAEPVGPSPPQPDFSNPENDDELMSLLVGRPVSPPAGWRGPGRDAPDAPSEPPSIYARRPATVPKPQPPQPPPPPPQQAPPIRAQAPPPAAPPAPPRAPTPVPPPVSPADSGDAVPQPYRRTYVAPGIATSESEAPVEEQPATEGLFGESPLESSVVGPPPSLARAIEAGKERKASARRTIEMPDLPALRSHEGQLGTLAVGGTAIIALALVVVFYLMRPTIAPPVAPQAAPSVTVPPAVVLETPPPAASPRRNDQNKQNASPAPNASGKVVAPPSVAPTATARAAAQATQRALATTAPAPPRPAPTAAHVALAPKPVHTAAPKPRPHYRPANPSIVVSMQGVDAHYGPGGHAVRVLWGANGQASAHVELTDERGDVLSSTDVPGGRYNAVLYVPRTYRGSVFVQVVSVGAQGERVTQSTSLPAFSH